MNTTRKKVDKIDTIKAMLLKRAEHYAKALDEVRRKLKQIDDVEAMLPELAAEGDTANLADEQSGKPYAHLSLTEAVKLALIHAATPVTLGQLRDILTRGGFTHEPKATFSASVNATLHRLSQQGLVTIAEDDEERKTFARKL